jgi:hypothetical protein
VRLFNIVDFCTSDIPSATDFIDGGHCPKFLDVLITPDYGKNPRRETVIEVLRPSKLLEMLETVRVNQ